jgi:hypothetical protein
MKYLKYHSCISKFCLFSNESVKMAEYRLSGWASIPGSRIGLFLLPGCKSYPTTDLMGTGGFLPSKYGHSGVLIIFLLIVPRVIKREALAAPPVMSTKTAKLHCSWRADL